MNKRFTMPAVVVSAALARKRVTNPTLHELPSWHQLMEKY